MFVHATKYLAFMCGIPYNVTLTHMYLQLQYCTLYSTENLHINVKECYEVCRHFIQGIELDSHLSIKTKMF